MSHIHLCLFMQEWDRVQYVYPVGIILDEEKDNIEPTPPPSSTTTTTTAGASTSSSSSSVHGSSPMTSTTTSKKTGEKGKKRKEIKVGASTAQADCDF